MAAGFRNGPYRNCLLRLGYDHGLSSVCQLISQHFRCTLTEHYSYNEIMMHGNKATELNGLIHDDAVCIGLELLTIEQNECIYRHSPHNGIA